MQELLLRLRHLGGHGKITCLDCTISLDLPSIVQELATLHNKIGWDFFMTGMVTKQLVNIQSIYLLQQQSTRPASSWILGLITQLLQETYSQWIYRCVLVHDSTTSTLITSHKEDLMREISHQLVLGAEELAEEDRFLLECNFDKLLSTNREHQEYWLLAIQAARGACRLCTLANRSVRQSCIGTTYNMGKDTLVHTMNTYAWLHLGGLNNSQGTTISWKERAHSLRFQLQRCFTPIAYGV